MYNDTLLLFLKLLSAHLITDFILQKDNWIMQRNTLHYKAPSLYLHTLITALFAYLFSALWQNWQIPLIVFVTHTLIDIGKSYCKPLFIYFFIDQMLHWFVLLGCAWQYSTTTTDIIHTNEIMAMPNTFWVYAVAYLLVTFPMGYCIGALVKPFKEQLQQIQNQSNDTLADAGKWIGIFERLLILTFVLANQFAAIGFLIAAKSILRFNNKDESFARKETEYVLVGTLISYALSIFTGLIANKLIQL
ncbi:MAG: DUF3307 domain-containing protein [Bacteroidia bacterium]|nr:DUF3307 domain-containing protein [Bacteroidia bacterium]HQU99754.1 DUF3307 domain-containing protein [Bacteroidia bacterium]